MPHSTQKTILLICSFVICCAAIILAAVSFATEYWITQEYKSNGNDTSSGVDWTLTLHAGLFKIHAELPIFDSIDMTMKEAYNDNSHLMNFGIWVSTILFLSIGMVFGVVSAIFAAINSSMTPIEEITGVTGLYLWNGLACLFSLISVLLWVCEYCSYLVSILWSMKEVDAWIDQNVPTHAPSSLGYSFYIVCGVTFLYLANIAIVFLSTLNCDKNKAQTKEMDQGPADGMIMLY